MSQSDSEPELARKNIRLGWALFGLFCLLFARHRRRRVLYLQLD